MLCGNIPLIVITLNRDTLEMLLNVAASTSSLLRHYGSLIITNNDNLLTVFRLHLKVCGGDKALNFNFRSKNDTIETLRPSRCNSLLRARGKTIFIYYGLAKYRNIVISTRCVQITYGYREANERSGLGVPDFLADRWPRVSITARSGSPCAIWPATGTPRCNRCSTSNTVPALSPHPWSDSLTCARVRQFFILH